MESQIWVKYKWTAILLMCKKYIFLLLTCFFFNDIFHKWCIITKKEGKSNFYVTSHETITWKDEYKFDEYLEQANKKDAKLQKGQSKGFLMLRGKIN